jgi:hypothetical protein
VWYQGAFASAPSAPVTAKSKLSADINLRLHIEEPPEYGICSAFKSVSAKVFFHRQ